MFKISYDKYYDFLDSVAANKEATESKLPGSQVESSLRKF